MKPALITIVILASLTSCKKTYCYKCTLTRYENSAKVSETPSTKCGMNDGEIAGYIAENKPSMALYPDYYSTFNCQKED